MRRLLTAIGLLAFAFSSASPARAASIVVNTNVDDNTVNGNCTLREAIIAANNDEPVDDCAGELGTDTITFDDNYIITLAGSQLPAISTEMSITGNGVANTIVQASECNPVTLPGGCTPATYRVFETGASGDLTLTDVKIQHGHCELACDTSVYDGGGIYNAGTLTLNASQVSDNSVGSGGGGGIYNLGALTIQDHSVIGGPGTGNLVTGIQTGGGGGICTISGNVIVDNSTVSGNTSTNMSNVGLGGGIRINGGSLTVRNHSVIGGAGAGNTTGTGPGGGIYIVNGTVTVDASTISANTAGTGGGIRMSNGTLTLQNGSVLGGVGAGNNASNGGGGIRIDSGTMTVSNSRISANTALSFGGGIYNRGTVILVDSVVGGTGPGEGNVVTQPSESFLRDGGGIYSIGTAASVTLTRSILSGNSTLGRGGGIFNGGTLTIEDGSLVGGVGSPNTAGSQGGGIYTTNATISGVNNDGVVTVDASIISANMALTGGGIWSDHGWVSIQNGSVIGGQGAGNLASGIGSNGGGVWSSIGSTLIVDNSTISANEATNSGGGIFASGITTISNGSVIGSPGAGNTAHNNYGGGVYNAGILTVDASTISANSAGQYGGGIRNFSGTVSILNGSVIGGPGAGNTAGVNGGNIHNGSTVYGDTTSHLTIIGSTVSHGNAVNYGGGIYNLSFLTVDASTISANEAAFGGGIFNAGIGCEGIGEVTIQNGSVIGGAGAGNTATDDGGGIENVGNLVIDASAISGNSAGQRGGGIYNGCTLTVQNGSVVGGAGAGNTATNGGGIYNNWLATLDASTISGNAAINDGNGGGIYNNSSAGTPDAALQVRNGSVIGGIGAGNMAANGGGIYNTLNNTINVTGSTIMGNVAAQLGGAVFTSSPAQINASCIIGNSSPAMRNDSQYARNATGNWWGNPGGPNVGAADTTSGLWDTSGWLTSASMDCKGGPFNLTASANGQSAINLTWLDAATDETGFRVERSPDGADPWTQLAQPAANSTEYADSGLACGTTYYYQVSAYRSEGGLLSYSDVASATTDPCAPLVSLSPTSLSFGNVMLTKSSAPQTVTLTNDGDLDLEVYQLALPTGSEFSLGNDLCSNKTVGSGLTCTFQVTFKPVAPAGPKSDTLNIPSNAASSPDSLALNGNGTPLVPVLTSPANGSAVYTRKPTLTWEAVPGATRYLVTVLNSKGRKVINKSVTKTGLTAPSALPYGRYTWRVAANRGVITPPSADWVFFITKMVSPANNATALPGTPTFTWKSAGTGVTYTLVIASDASFKTVVRKIARIKKLTYTLPVDKALAPGVYFWRIRTSTGFTMPGWSFTIGP